MELKIIDKKPLSLPEVSEEMSQKEIASVQQKTYEFANKFSKFNKDVSSKVLEDLKALNIPRMEDAHLVQIINLAPKTESEIKTIFAGSKTTVTAESVKKILETLRANEK